MWRILKFQFIIIYLTWNISASYVKQLLYLINKHILYLQYPEFCIKRQSMLIFDFPFITLIISFWIINNFCITLASTNQQSNSILHSTWNSAKHICRELIWGQTSFKWKIIYEYYLIYSSCGKYEFFSLAYYPPKYPVISQN